ncbi:MAG TPA: right-handed parallel beta-helix repeat-containing protein [Gaiellaceae bacterium]|nr:right-handed parallel beta-helix repeat-containing protein [Gaiellaceae bacterium]
MSYTLRGRIETRLAALVPVLVAACAIAGARHRWWPVELVALMAVVGVALDLNVWHRLLPYQPAWATIPLGAVELAILTAIVYGFGLHAPLVPALALFGAGWLAAFVLAQAAFPLLRLGYAEDGGELGRAGPAAAGVVLLALVGSAATWHARLPPVVHLATGVHQGPLVIRHREILQGEPGAVVRGGIVVAHDNVQIRDVTVLGGENGITIDGVRGTVLDGVTVQGAKLDGIHVRQAGVVVRDCSVDMLGNRLGQGIDISFNLGTGMSMVEGCTVVGGQEGITTHVSMTEIMDNRVSRTTGEAISVDEMSMGTAAHNTVRDALGVGLYCNDQSMCMFEHNTVVGTRADDSSGIRTRRGIAVLAGFQSEANLWQNRLVANPVARSAITNSIIRKTSRAAW